MNDFENEALRARRVWEDRIMAFLLGVAAAAAVFGGLLFKMEYDLKQEREAERCESSRMREEARFSAELFESRYGEFAGPGSSLRQDREKQR